jgi:hypothetical protein
MNDASSGRTPKRDFARTTLQPFNRLTTMHEQHEFPIDFAVHNLEPGNAWRRASVRAGHAAGIEKSNPPAQFIAWNMRVTVQQNVDIIRDMIRRYMLQSEFETAAPQINDEWPLEIAVAVSSDKDNRWPDRPQLIENRFGTNISEMPNLIGALGHLADAVGQPIVGIRKNENAPRFSGFCVNCHRAF